MQAMSRPCRAISIGRQTAPNSYRVVVRTTISPRASVLPVHLKPRHPPSVPAAAAQHPDRKQVPMEATGRQQYSFWPLAQQQEQQEQQQDDMEKPDYRWQDFLSYTYQVQLLNATVQRMPRQVQRLQHELTALGKPLPSDKLQQLTDPASYYELQDLLVQTHWEKYRRAKQALQVAAGSTDRKEWQQVCDQAARDLQACREAYVQSERALKDYNRINAFVERRLGELNGKIRGDE